MGEELEQAHETKVVEDELLVFAGIDDPTVCVRTLAEKAARDDGRKLSTTQISASAGDINEGMRASVLAAVSLQDVEMCRASGWAGPVPSCTRRWRDRPGRTSLRE